MKENRAVDWAALILRVLIGLTALYYGCQKALGVFGGPGIHGTIGFMESVFSIPPVFAVLAICGEFLGGLGMIFGVLTRIAALGFSCVMVVATYENWKTPGLFNALFTHPSPDQPPKVFYTVALLAGALAVLILGGGAFSLDSKLFLKKSKKGSR